jgi:SOS-response transcriptional repressor LexA
MEASASGEIELEATREISPENAIKDIKDRLSRLESVLKEQSNIKEEVKEGRFRWLPVLGHPPCGYPLLSEEQAEGHTFVLKDDLGYAGNRQGLYALIASGDSLKGDGIDDGEKLIVDPRDKDVVDGKIYVVRTPDNEVTVKHVYRIDGKIKLVPSNKKYRTIELSQIEIMGRVILSGNWTRR